VLGLMEMVVNGVSTRKVTHITPRRPLQTVPDVAT